MKKFITIILLSLIFSNFTYAIENNMQENPINLNIEKETKEIGYEDISSEIYKYTNI